MSDQFLTNQFPTNDMNDPQAPADPNAPYGVSRALPTPTTPAGFAAGQPPYDAGDPTLPPTGYPPAPASLAGGAGVPLGPGGAGRPPRGRDWRRWGLIGVIVLVGILVLGGGAVLAGVALAHGTTTAHTTTAPASTTTATPSPIHQLPVYTVTAVSATTINATNASGTAVTISLSAQTVYVRADQPASLSDITSGTKIRVLGHQKGDGSIVARRVMIVVPTAHGKVTAINGNTLTIQTAKGTVTITITSTTKFGKGQTLGVIHVGDVVVVAGLQNSDGSYTALAILDRTAATNASGGTGTATPAA